MPVRLGDAADLERWHARRVVPSLLCAIVAAGLSCQGDCPPSTTSTGTALTVHARYVLARFGGQPLPATLADAGGIRVRLLADTLLFPGAGTASAGTYSEIVVLGTARGTAAETSARTTSSGPWTRVQRDQLSLGAFGGGSAGGTTATATLAELTTGAQLGVNTSDGRAYVFEAR